MWCTLASMAAIVTVCLPSATPQELIFGCVEEAPPSWKWAGWGDAKAFLFDIIANKRNGIDLDKLVRSPDLEHGVAQHWHRPHYTAPSRARVSAAGLLGQRLSSPCRFAIVHQPSRGCCCLT